MKLKIASKWYLFLIVTVFGFIIDLLTKYWASSKLPLGIPVKVIGEAAQFLFVYNKAAVFGMDPRHFFPSFPLNGFFFVFNTIAMILILIYFNALKKEEKLMQWGISLVMPGALGNLFDRIIHPHLGVVDFIRLGVSETLYWPIFNIADVYVTVAVILICINFAMEGKNKKAGKAIESVQENGQMP